MASLDHSMKTQMDMYDLIQLLPCFYKKQKMQNEYIANFYTAVEILMDTKLKE